MACEAWTSTKAFSVYSVLFKSPAPLTQEEITRVLQRAFREDIDEDYVAVGAAYLITKRMIGTTTDGRLGLMRPGKRVKRINDDIDLDWVES